MHLSVARLMEMISSAEIVQVGVARGVKTCIVWGAGRAEGRLSWSSGYVKQALAGEGGPDVEAVKLLW